MASIAARGATGTKPTPEYLAQSQSEFLKRIIWVSTALPLVLVILRCYTRLSLRRVFGLDDYIMIAAMLLLIAYAVVTTVAADKGLGRHIEYVLPNPQNVVDVAFLSFVSQPFVVMSCALGKTSFALTLIRVAVQRWIIVLLWFIIITMNTLHIIISLLVFLRCENPRHLWDPAIPSKCLPSYVFDNIALFVGSYSAATDFTLALLPWAILWKLQMKNREKFGVAMAMSLGVFAGSVAIVKIQHLVADSDDKDFTYSVALLLWWAGVENGLILLGACVPTLWPLLKKFYHGSSDKKEEPAADNHDLVTFSNFNPFAPKARRGLWSTTIETQTRNDHPTDNQSEQSILKRGSEDNENAETQREVRRTDEMPTSDHSTPGISKKMEVDVAHDQA